MKERNYCLQPEKPVVNTKIYVITLPDTTKAIIIPVHEISFNPEKTIETQLNHDRFECTFTNKSKKHRYPLKPWSPESFTMARPDLSDRLQEAGGLWIPVRRADKRLALVHFFWPRNFSTAFLHPRPDLDPYTDGSYAFHVA